MKKTIVTALLLVITVLISGCKGDGQGTYFPDSQEMQNNLEKKAYRVTVEAVQTENYSGTRLTAEKKDDNIVFFWLDDGSDVELLKTELNETYTGFNSLVTLEKDGKFGTLVFCATETAKNDAGIVIVDVKIN